MEIGDAHGVTGREGGCEGRGGCGRGTFQTGRWRSTDGQEQFINGGRGARGGRGKQRGGRRGGVLILGNMLYLLPYPPPPPPLSPRVLLPPSQQAPRLCLLPSPRAPMLPLPQVLPLLLPLPRVLALPLPRSPALPLPPAPLPIPLPFLRAPSPSLWAYPCFLLPGVGRHHIILTKSH